MHCLRLDFVLLPGRSRRNQSFQVKFVYNLLYAIGEILTTTWPGRLVLGVAMGSVIAWLARL